MASHENNDEEEVKQPEDADQQRERREFLRTAGKAGVAAGLAHFMLLGGGVQKALAQQDTDCAEIANDVCRPSVENPDTCQANEGIPNTETGDSCKPAEDPDECSLPPYTVASGDQCPGQMSGDPDRVD